MIEFPELVNFFIWKYGSPSLLILSCGKVIGSCSEGVLQGDPFAAFFFALGALPVLQEIAITHADKAIPFALMDDFTILTRDAHVDTIIEDIIPRLQSIGLTLSREKCIGIHNPRLQPSFTTVPSTSSGAIILGAPIGTWQYVEDTLRSKCSDITKSLTTISLLDANLAFPLLQESINTRPSYFLRLISPTIVIEFAQSFDSAMDKAIAIVTKCPTSHLPAQARKIRSLPIALGGLGIRAAMDSNQDSYVASAQYAFNFLFHRYQKYWKIARPVNGEYCRLYDQLIDTQKIYDFDTIEDTLIESVSEFDVISHLVTHQRVLWKRRMKLLHTEFIEDPNIPDSTKAWITSCATRGCASWLYSAVQSSPQLQISADDYLENIRLRLGLPITETNAHVPLMCYCDDTQLNHPNLDHHALGCKSVSIDRIYRHEVVVHHLIQTLKRLFPKCEIIKFKRVQDENELNNGDPEKPKRISDFQFTVDGRKHFIDVAVVNPSAPTYIAKQPSSSTVPLVAAGTEELRKRSKYEKFLPTPDDFRFIAFVVEATGRLGTKASEFLDSMTGLDKEPFALTDREIAHIRRYLVHVINAAIIRGNARIIRKFRTQTVPPEFAQDSFHWPALPTNSPALPLAPPVVMSPLHSSHTPTNSQLNRVASDQFMLQVPVVPPVEGEEDP